MISAVDTHDEIKEAGKSCPAVKISGFCYYRQERRPPELIPVAFFKIVAHIVRAFPVLKI